MGVPKGAGNLRGARDKNWTVVAACLRSFRRALTAVHPEPARGPTLVTSATQLKIGEPCEFSANHENRPEFLDVTLQRPPTNSVVSPPLNIQQTTKDVTHDIRKLLDGIYVSWKGNAEVDAA